MYAGTSPIDPVPGDRTTYEGERGLNMHWFCLACHRIKNSLKRTVFICIILAGNMTPTNSFLNQTFFFIIKAQPKYMYKKSLHEQLFQS